MELRKALILGASGLIGRRLIRYLMDDALYAELRLPVRRPQPIEHRKVEQREMQFDHMDDHADFFAVDDVFCCLGTTMKKAGSQESFETVDRIYPLQAARLAAQKGAKRFLIVTAAGADPKSPIFYNRIKGLVEEDLKNSGLQELHVFRPSLLKGKRMETRLGEEAAGLVLGVLGFAMVGPLRRYRAIEAGDVARAMQVAARRREVGQHVYESERIQEIADGFKERLEN